MASLFDLLFALFYIAKTNKDIYNKNIHFNTLKRKIKRVCGIMKNKLTYSTKNNTQIPNIQISKELEDLPDIVGKYGMLRETYLKEHRSGLYIRMLMDNSLWKHIVEIDNQAQNQLDVIINNLMEQENVTEELKAQNQLLWIQKVNNIKNRAEETILNNIVYK